MTFCCSHQSVIIAQLSSEKLPPTAGEKQYRNPQPDNFQRVRDLGTFSPKWVVSIKSLPSWLRELCGRGGEREEEPEEVQDTKETRLSKHRTTETPLNSQQLWQHEQGPHRSAPDGVLVLRREMDT